MKKSLIFALLLLIFVGVLYRYTERYEYDKPKLEKNEKITEIVKEKNITQEDLDILKKVLKR
ncbi:hypothetical protein CL646_04040 [bacterium]|jgi:hypothetical protein|nr:hypothetical protein [bacterium]|tara:strand:- start:152 stop:337 length:186 start_codon:yes stop_codon:yes gene_type:complete